MNGLILRDCDGEDECRRRQEHGREGENTKENLIEGWK